MEGAQIRDDLDYVRRAVRRSDAAGTPPALWYFWAAIVLVGFSLIDFAPAYVGTYWMIAAPAGFLLSCWIGWRHGRAIGQISREVGRRQMLHWGALMAAVFLLMPLAGAGALPGSTLPQAILLMVAVGYFLAGVHLHRPLLWIGLLMAAAYAALFFVDRYAWTGIAVLIALALTTAGYMGRGARDGE